MSVQEMLRALLLLQGIDKSIYDYEQEVNAIPDQKGELDAQYAEKETALNEHDNTIFVRKMYYSIELSNSDSNQIPSEIASGVNASP